MSRRAWALVLCTVACSAGRVDDVMRTGVAPIDPPCEAVERIDTATQRIPFGLFSPAIGELAALAEGGFTMAGPWYQPEIARAALATASANGLGVVFPVGYPHERYKDTKRIDWDLDTTRAELAEQIEELRDEPAIVAWYLLPEELDERDQGHLEFLRVATETIRAADPKGRPILSYQANHRGAARLAPIMAHLDVSTKGAYANFAGFRDERAWVRWSIDELEAAGDSPAWLLPEMFEDPAGADAATIAAWVRHDVYAGLVAGATGVVVFSGWRRPNFDHYDDYLDAYRVVATELNGSLALADVLLAGKRCRAPVVEIVDGPRDVSFEASGRVHHMDPLGRLDLAHAGARWSWLVNSSPSVLTVRADAWRGAEAVVGAEHRVDDETFALPAWGVAVIRR